MNSSVLQNIMKQNARLLIQLFCYELQAASCQETNQQQCCCPSDSIWPQVGPSQPRDFGFSRWWQSRQQGNPKKNRNVMVVYSTTKSFIKIF